MGLGAPRRFASGGPLQHVDVRLETHPARSIRWMALVMVVAVTALFSMVPFKVPRVLFVMPQAMVQVAEATVRPPSLAPKLAPASAVQMVHGRQDLHPDGMVLVPLAPLYAGTHALAGISAWKARRIALPPPFRLRLRAPPAVG